MMSTDKHGPNIYGISVKFKVKDGWSKSYVYAHDKPLEPDSLIVVNSYDDFYTIARVKECTYKYYFDPNINYRTVIMVLPFKFGDAV